MASISLILGYGIFKAPNPKYQKYIELSLGKALSTQPDYLFLTGGHTNHLYPDLSEAQSIKDFIVTLHPELNSKIILSESSFTTPQSLKHSFDFLSQKQIIIDQLHVIGDSIRIPKAFYLALSLLQPQLSPPEKLKILFETFIVPELDITQPVEVKYQNLTVTGIAFSDTMSMAACQITSSMLDMHFLDYPALEDLFVSWRKQKWGV